MKKFLYVLLFLQLSSLLAIHPALQKAVDLESSLQTNLEKFTQALNQAEQHKDSFTPEDTELFNALKTKAIEHIDASINSDSSLLVERTQNQEQERKARQRAFDEQIKKANRTKTDAENKSIQDAQKRPEFKRLIKNFERLPLNFETTIHPEDVKRKYLYEKTQLSDQDLKTYNDQYEKWINAHEDADWDIIPSSMER